MFSEYRVAIIICSCYENINLTQLKNLYIKHFGTLKILYLFNQLFKLNSNIYICMTYLCRRFRFWHHRRQPQFDRQLASV